MSLIDQLSRLQADSGLTLPRSVTAGIDAGGGTFNLVRFDAGRRLWVPNFDTRDLASHVHRKQRVFAIVENAFKSELDSALGGGPSYPVLISVLGALTGGVGAAASLAFGAATTALDLARRTSELRSRIGDEIWLIEEIGKVWDDPIIGAGRYIPTHVASYLLIDPYRTDLGRQNGWLLHEARKEIALDG